MRTEKRCDRKRSEPNLRYYPGIYPAGLKLILLYYFTPLYFNSCTRKLYLCYYVVLFHTILLLQNINSLVLLLDLVIFILNGVSLQFCFWIHFPVSCRFG
jgi:hypothetical protein